MAFVNKIEATKGFEPKEVLEDGTYNAVLSAIIDLELQVNDYDPDKIKIEHRVKLLFEIPEKLQDIDGQQLPMILSREVPLSSGERSNFYKVVNALTKKKLSQEQVYDMIKTDGTLNSLLGKALVLQVESYTTKHQDSDGNAIRRNKITGFSALRASLDQPQAVREPFMFEVGTPDLEIFKDKLSRWTRDTIMTANNNEDFPAELHKVYRDIKEAEANKKSKE